MLVVTLINSYKTVYLHQRELIKYELGTCVYFSVHYVIIMLVYYYIIYLKCILRYTGIIKKYVYITINHKKRTNYIINLLQILDRYLLKYYIKLLIAILLFYVLVFNIRFI